MHRWPQPLSSVSADLTLVQQYITWWSCVAVNYIVSAVSRTPNRLCKYVSPVVR